MIYFAKKNFFTKIDFSFDTKFIYNFNGLLILSFQRDKWPVYRPPRPQRKGQYPFFCCYYFSVVVGMPIFYGHEKIVERILKAPLTSKMTISRSNYFFFCYSSLEVSIPMFSNVLRTKKNSEKKSWRHPWQ